jgi:sulfate permease, SulP family
MTNPPRLEGAQQPDPLRWVPGLNLLRTYDAKWLRPDLVAAITLAAYVLPAGIGDASLANLPPETGLYACIFSGLAFWLFCSSRYTAISVTSAISILIGVTLGEFANGDALRFAALASCTALLVAAIAFVASLVKAGAVVAFISESVMLGFKSGVALYLGATQLPKLFGFKGSHGDFWERTGDFFRHIGDTNPYALALGLSALAILVLGKVFFKNRPISILVLVGGVLIASLGEFSSKGVKLLGEIPTSIPMLQIPSVHLSDLNDLVPLAVACFLLGAVETAAIGRMFAAKHRIRFDSNQEFLGMAAGNLLSGLGHGFPVSGGMSQSLVNESAGARTPLSGLFSSLLMLLITLFMADKLRNLPQSVLAAIVLVAVSGLFKASALVKLWKSHRSEFVIAIAALLGVLGSGLLRGVLIGALISLVLVMRRASRPHVAVLGRVPGTSRFTDRERHPENELIPDVLILRPEVSLLYFNINYIADFIRSRVSEGGDELKAVLCDLSSTPTIDLQAVETLNELAREFSSTGMQMHALEARANVRDMLHREGDKRCLRGIDESATVASVVDALSGRTRAAGS